MKRFLSVLVSGILLSTILFGLVGTAFAGEETITLKVFSMPANTSGILEGWTADILKKRLGIAIDILPSGDQGEQKLQALMASGDLPDIVVFKENTQVINAVAGDMLLAFDDYKDMLPNVYRYAPNAVKYYAENVSDGKGKAYSLGTNVQVEVEPNGNMNWGPWIRYDLYKKIGSPEIATSDDYLGVLKQMQDLMPTNADGKKVYAFSIWKDWDRSYLFLASMLGNINGINYPNEGTLVEIDHMDNNRVSSILAEDSWYFKGLKLYFDANQMGLMDPDSMTQRFDDALQKATDERTLFSWWGWALGTFNSQENQNNGIGFRPVNAKNAKILHQGMWPTGRAWSLSVGKNTKYPEKCMAFVDMLYNPEALLELMNGPRGVVWDLDKDNNPYVLEDGYQYLLDTTKELPGGNNLARGSLGVLNAWGLSGTTILEDYNNNRLSNSYWTRPEYAPAETKLVQEWQADYKALDQIDYLRQHDGIAMAPFAAMPPFTDEMEQISARVGDVLKTISWRMVFAKDEAEYNALKAEMIEKAEGMGINDFVEWFDAEYTKAIEFGAKYSD